MNTYENSLLRHFVHFSQILLDAVENYSPHIVCTYLFELAQKYNSFYAHCPIQDAETDNMKNLRITITIATANILSIGLGVLGIDTVEKM